MFSVPLWLIITGLSPAVIAQVHLAPDVASVVLGIPRRRVHADDVPLPGGLGAKQMTPGMAVRHLDSPAETLGILDRPLDLFVGVPRSSHAQGF